MMIRLKLGRVLRLAAIAATFLLFALPGQAQNAKPWASAQRIMEDCSSEPLSSQSLECVNYIEGVKDILNYLRVHSLTNARVPCPPPQITIGQLRDVVVTFIRRNPQYYHVEAAPAVYAALVAAFPCQ
jgi:hypothetical protein